MECVIHSRVWALVPIGASPRPEPVVVSLNLDNPRRPRAAGTGFHHGPGGEIAQAAGYAPEDSQNRLHFTQVVWKRTTDVGWRTPHRFDTESK